MQYRMKAALEEKGLYSPTILTWDWGSDGTMTVMGSIPRIRYFCWYNNWADPEIREAREQYLSEQSADVIVIQGNKKSEYPEFRNYTHEDAIWGIGVTGGYVYYHYYLPTQ